MKILVVDLEPTTLVDEFSLGNPGIQRLAKVRKDAFCHFMKISRVLERCTIIVGQHKNCEGC